VRGSHLQGRRKEGETIVGWELQGKKRKNNNGRRQNRDFSKFTARKHKRQIERKERPNDHRVASQKKKKGQPHNTSLEAHTYMAFVWGRGRMKRSELGTPKKESAGGEKERREHVKKGENNHLKGLKAESKRPVRIINRKNGNSNKREG